MLPGSRDKTTSEAKGVKEGRGASTVGRQDVNKRAESNKKNIASLFVIDMILFVFVRNV